MKTMQLGIGLSYWKSKENGDQRSKIKIRGNVWLRRSDVHRQN